MAVIAACSYEMMRCETNPITKKNNLPNPYLWAKRSHSLSQEDLNASICTYAYSHTYVRLVRKFQNGIFLYLVFRCVRSEQFIAISVVPWEKRVFPNAVE